MTTTFTVDTLRGALKRVIANLDASADELNSLDAQLGDGDLGVSLVRGARAVEAELPALPEDLGLALLKCAQAFTKLSGSTYGTLLATGLMSAAKATRGRSEVAWSEVSSLLGNATQAMAQRSGGGLGDKTVLDALDAASSATAGLTDPAEIAAAADQAVAECLDRFRNQPARQGRARIFGDKSVGKDDPGMMALKRMTEALNQNH